MARDVCNYITCEKGHKVFVIWSESRQCFGFTCDECDQHSETAISMHGLVRCVLVQQPRPADFKTRATGERD